MKIFYVHHALRNIGNPPTQNDDIKPLGIKDAKIVSKLFTEAKSKYLNIRAIYTSNYLRCLKTAEIINKKLNVPIIAEPRFNEFVGVHSAVKGKENKNGETWVECQNRIIAALKDIVNTYNDNDAVICVTSGVNITAFISVAYGIKPSNNLPFPLVPSCSPIGFDIKKEMFNGEK